MKRHKIFFYSIIVALFTLIVVSCEEDDDNNKVEKESEFESLQSPYLICAGRNPGGVGFDFEYNGKKGGANNIDKPSVDDFEYDLIIRTIKGEKGDGSLGGASYIQLFSTNEAVNYSTVDASCKGFNKFNALTSADLQTYTFSSDDASFDVASVEKGETGAPLMGKLQSEYNKLAIGEKWKSAAKNDIADDEPIWIVKTREGKLVKFIITDFPADPAPTATGYVEIIWDYLD